MFGDTKKNPHWFIWSELHVKRASIAISTIAPFFYNEMILLILLGVFED